jgi:hypothetical protein
MGLIGVVFKIILYSFLLLSSGILYYFFFINANPIDDSHWSTEPFVVPKAPFVSHLCVTILTVRNSYKQMASRLM